jgi:hypothetical protein
MGVNLSHLQSKDRTLPLPPSAVNVKRYGLTPFQAGVNTIGPEQVQIALNLVPSACDKINP